MDLGLDHDQLNACVQCGLCLASCPTYQVTGDETLSPRGRIALMRELQWHGASPSPDVVHSLETCIQCRGCEPACPSGVEFGHLMEGTRKALAESRRITPWWQRAALSVLPHPRLLRAVTLLLALVQRLMPLPRRFGLPRLPLRSPKLEASGSDVHLFTGCIMDAWQRDVHIAAARVLEATGCGVRPTGHAAPCCGTLHVHAGLVSEGRGLARQVMESLDDGRPVIVDSAGCGAGMKDYGRLLGTAQARSFASHVFDIHEWLALHRDRLPNVKPLDLRVAVQDPCHQRHVQGVHQATRDVLGPFVRELVELDDEGLCCGAGGAFALMQPELAGAVRSRKIEAIRRANADVVASANPGCSMHLATSGVKVVHPVEILRWALERQRSLT